MQRISIERGLVAFAAFIACDEGHEPSSRLAIEVAPIRYQSINDACYGLTVYDASYDPKLPDKGVVWREEHVCGSRYGFDGEVTYIGTCVAGQRNTVALVLENLYEGSAVGPGAAGALGTDLYVNPCPKGDPCTLSETCKENSDTRITFDLTVMRDAGQGFFDIGVDFEDVFCSAKVDCQYSSGKAIELLFDPRATPPVRSDTAVLALACTAGDLAKTTLHMSDVTVTCGTKVWTIDPGRDVGNYWTWQGSDKPAEGSPLYQAQIATGAEQLVNEASGKDARKLFWTVALGLDAARVAGCTLGATMTVADDGDPFWRSPGTSYPEIVVSLPLSAANGDLTCGRHELDGKLSSQEADPVIKTGYARDRGYANCLRGDFASDEAVFCDAPGYDARKLPPPPNVPSLGYQATQTAEFGDGLDVTANGLLRGLTVTFSDWAKYSTWASHPTYGANNATWTHPITIKVYGVADAPVHGHAGVGALLGQVTEIVTIPWRPETSPTCSDDKWSPNGVDCYGGKTFDWTFNLRPLGIAVPRKLVITVAYNTQTWGAQPIGADGPYNSLNVGVPTTTPGGNLDLDVVYWNTSTAGWYTDGGTAGVGVLRYDDGWSVNVPAFALTAF